jgi:hypothetical protein
VNALDEIVPFPQRVEDATADGLARVYTAHSQLFGRLAERHPDLEERETFEIGFVAAYSLAYLLRELEEAAGITVADRVARTLWRDVQDASVLRLCIREWLSEDYDIDSAAIDAVAAQVVEPNPDAGSQAGMGGAA